MPALTPAVGWWPSRSRYDDPIGGPANWSIVLGQPRSPDWDRCRRGWLVAHPFCAACGARVTLQVHHLIPFHLNKALELDPRNLLTLCEIPNRHCHWRIGHAFDWTAYNPHAVEDAALGLKRIQARVYHAVAAAPRMPMPDDLLRQTRRFARAVIRWALAPPVQPGLFTLAVKEQLMAGRWKMSFNFPPIDETQPQNGDIVKRQLRVESSGAVMVVDADGNETPHDPAAVLEFPVDTDISPFGQPAVTPLFIFAENATGRLLLADVDDAVPTPNVSTTAETDFTVNDDVAPQQPGSFTVATKEEV